MEQTEARRGGNFAHWSQTNGKTTIESGYSFEIFVKANGENVGIEVDDPATLMRNFLREHTFEEELGCKYGRHCQCLFPMYLEWDEPEQDPIKKQGHLRFCIYWDERVTCSH